ncbi:MAG: hypothetical protein ACXWW7_15920, partial [Nocardioides sp.]
GSDGHEGEDTAATGEVPGGLMVSSAGYTLELQDPVVPAGRARQFSFVIEGPAGPVTSYDVAHEERLHLIAVRRDFTGFQHVHPDLATNGTWTTSLDLDPGQWRVFADFKPTGAGDLTLGADLLVPGQVAVPVERAATRVARVDDYTVTLEGELVPGEDSTVELSVAKGGRPVTDLQPYLGAYGHLVALRGGDLAYLHVHPEGEPGDGQTLPGPEVEFVAEVPSVGSYHLYLDFKHDGVVRTARFTLEAGEGR